MGAKHIPKPYWKGAQLDNGWKLPRMGKCVHFAFFVFGTFWQAQAICTHNRTPKEKERTNLKNLNLTKN